ncbi:MAG TPA: OmpA family protein [Polyangiaceae bacterium]
MLTALILVVAATGCVSTGKYDAAVADAERAKVSLRESRTEAGRRLAAKDAELQALKHSIRDAEARCARTLAELQTTAGAALGCSKALDEATAMNAQLRAELERLGKDADALLSAKGALAASLDQAKARLEELRKAQAAAEAKAGLFRDVALRLKRMVDAGELQILLRSGRMVLVLPTDVLFDSGRTKVKPRGREALGQVGAVLATVQGRRFQVAGHTDDEPIRFSGFASNFELSAERGLAVVAFLIESGMRPETLSAAGYGEFDPIVANDSAAHRAQNRRIEITVQPNIDEFVAVPLPR